MHPKLLIGLAGVVGLTIAGVGFAQAPADPAAAAPVPARPTPMQVFANALVNGWQHKSSATVDVGVDIGSARKPIRVEAGPGQALILQHPPIAPATVSWRS